MVKRTLYFGNPAYLSSKLEQLVIRKPDSDETRTIPIEDIGVLMLDNQQITLSQHLMNLLLENNTALITCNGSHMPSGLFLPLESNTVQSERFRNQIEASLPLKKQLWQQTVSKKIRNQAAMLTFATERQHPNMLIWSKDVRSGDPDNLEGRAAAYYWKNLFGDNTFTRDREGGGPNILLNFGYAILRAIIARSLVASGLLPTLGIHHHNRYNAYCLADDIMEPYRPFVDKIVFELVKNGNDDVSELTKDAKIRLLEIPVVDVLIEGRKSPLMIAACQTTSSLFKCFAGESKSVVYPEFI